MQATEKGEEAGIYVRRSLNRHCALADLIFQKLGDT